MNILFRVSINTVKLYPHQHRLSLLTIGCTTTHEEMLRFRKKYLAKFR